MGKIKVALLSILLAACATNPHKVATLDTTLKSSAPVSGSTELGIKDGDKAIVQKKVLMGEHLRALQNEVYELQDHVYGVEKYGSLGLFGVLRECKIEQNLKANGGSGALAWTEQIDRVADSEDKLKIGLDQNSQIIGVSEEYLSDRIARFEKYESILNARKVDLDDKIANCKMQTATQKYDLEKRLPASN